MRFHTLGKTDISVSEICLGTMTWGTQNSEAEAHGQIDFALERGVNFIDTAELYPTTPASAETYGLTEEYIGSWIAASGKRDKIVLASKVAGPGRDYIRDGSPMSADTITQALDDSLKRLKTDYLDLYQLHWPNRGHYHFRRSWTYDPSQQDTAAIHDDLLECLHALDVAQKAGKIRAVGVSNETAWGTMRLLTLAEKHGLPRVASIQNEYNLLYRTHDLDLADVSHHEHVGLLAYSPLAAGLLTGKYLGGQIPAGSRLSINTDLGGRFGPYQEPAVQAYSNVAQKHGLDFGQMALAFCLTRPFMTSVIIGATTLAQLDSDIGAADLTLSAEVLADIAGVFRQYPAPI